jgi:hypothetical protein
MLIDDKGTHIKVWMAALSEPASWTAEYKQTASLTTAFAPSWIVLQPRQAGDTGTQTFRLDDVAITSGLTGAP